MASFKRTPIKPVSSLQVLKKKECNTALCTYCNNGVYINKCNNGINKDMLYYKCMTCGLFQFNNTTDFPKTQSAIVPKEEVERDYYVVRNIVVPCVCDELIRIFQYKKGENKDKYGCHCDKCDVWYIDQNARTPEDVVGSRVVYDTKKIKEVDDKIVNMISK